jgi:hypothetical protein
LVHVLLHGSTENVINLEVQADEEIFEGSLERLGGRLSSLAVFAQTTILLHHTQLGEH